MTFRNQSAAARHVSSFHVELVRLGQATAGERSWIDHHLQACPRCAAMSASFEADRRAFHARHVVEAPRPFTAVAPLPSRRPRRAWLALGFLVPAAAGVVLFVAARHPGRPISPEPELGVKGGTTLVVAANRGQRVFPVRAGDRLRPGDRIRFVVEHQQYPFVLIASVDGAGGTTIYYPYGGSQSLRLEKAERVELPGSIVIDASPGPERIFALFSQRALHSTSVLSALARLKERGADAIRNVSSLEVGANEQISVVFEKDLP